MLLLLPTRILGNGIVAVQLPRLDGLKGSPFFLTPSLEGSGCAALLHVEKLKARTVGEKRGERRDYEPVQKAGGKIDKPPKLPY